MYVMHMYLIWLLLTALKKNGRNSREHGGLNMMLVRRSMDHLDTLTRVCMLTFFSDYLPLLLKPKSIVQAKAFSEALLTYKTTFTAQIYFRLFTIVKIPTNRAYGHSDTPEKCCGYT